MNFRQEDRICRMGDLVGPSEREAAGKLAYQFVAGEVGRNRVGRNPRQRLGFPGSVGKGFPRWCLGN